MRLGTVRYRVAGGVRALAFMPDGKTIAAKVENSSLRIFETATGRIVRELQSDEVLFHSYAITPDGKRIVSVGAIHEGGRYPTRGALRIWDARTLKEIRTIRWPGTEFPRHIRLQADGKIAVTGDSAAVRLWDLEGTEELPSHPLGDVQALAVSPDGTTIAMANRNGNFDIWEWKTKKAPRRIALGNRDVQSLDFSPDGKTLAVGIDYTDGAILVDVASGKRLHTLSSQKTRGIYQVVFTNDGKHLITPNRHGSANEEFPSGLLVWEVQTGKLVRELPTLGLGTTALAISSDGTRLAATVAASIRIWDTSTWKDITVDDDGHRLTVDAIAIPRTGPIVTGSFDETICLWDPKDGRPLRQIRSRDRVRSTALSSDGRLAARVCEPDDILVWDLVGGKMQFRLPGHGRYGRTSIAITRDGKRLLSFGRDFFLRVTDLSTGKAVIEHRIRPEGVMLPPDEQDGSTLEQFDFSNGMEVFAPDGSQFAWNIGRSCHVFDVQTGKERFKVGNPGGNVASYLAISPDGSQLISAVWARPVRRVQPNGQTRPQYEDTVISAWKLENGEGIFSVTVPELYNGVSPAFSPDGKRVAILTHGTKPHILVLSANDGKTLREFDVPAPPSWTIAFTPDGKRIACAMRDCTVLLFDIEPRKGE